MFLCFYKKMELLFILLENKKYKKEKENDIINEKNKSKFYETRNDKHTLKIIYENMNDFIIIYMLILILYLQIV